MMFILYVCYVCNRKFSFTFKTYLFHDSIKAYAGGMVMLLNSCSQQVVDIVTVVPYQSIGNQIICGCLNCSSTDNFQTQIVGKYNSLLQKKKRWDIQWRKNCLKQFGFLLLLFCVYLPRGKKIFIVNQLINKTKSNKCKSCR